MLSASADAERLVLEKHPELLRRVGGVLAEYETSASRLVDQRRRSGDVTRASEVRPRHRVSVRGLPGALSFIASVVVLQNMAGGRFAPRSVPVSNITAAVPDRLDVLAVAWAGVALLAAVLGAMCAGGARPPYFLGMAAVFSMPSAVLAVFDESTAVNERVAPWLGAWSLLLLVLAGVALAVWVRADRRRLAVTGGATARVAAARSGLEVEHERAVYRLTELMPVRSPEGRELRVDRDRAVAAARRSAGVLPWDGTEPQGPVPLGGYVLAARHAGRRAELDAAE